MEEDEAEEGKAAEILDRVMGEDTDRRGAVRRERAVEKACESRWTRWRRTEEGAKTGMGRKDEREVSSVVLLPFRSFSDRETIAKAQSFTDEAGDECMYALPPRHSNELQNPLCWFSATRFSLASSCRRSEGS